MNTILNYLQPQVYLAKAGHFKVVVKKELNFLAFDISILSVRWNEAFLSKTNPSGLNWDIKYTCFAQGVLKVSPWWLRVLWSNQLGEKKNWNQQCLGHWCMHWKFCMVKWQVINYELTLSGMHRMTRYFTSRWNHGVACSEAWLKVVE